MQRIYLLLLSILFVLHVVVNAVTTVKIIDGIEKLSYDSSSGNTEVTDTISIPALLSGPQSLQFLSKYCFSKSHERWEYKICPFDKITQQRTMGSSKINVIGTWSHWNSSPSHNTDSTKPGKLYNQMIYTNGTSCGGVGNTEVVLNLFCGNSTENIEIQNIDDSQFCKFIIDLSLPMSCKLLVA